MQGGPCARKQQTEYSLEGSILGRRRAGTEVLGHKGAGMFKAHSQSVASLPLLSICHYGSCCGLAKKEASALDQHKDRNPIWEPQWHSSLLRGGCLLFAGQRSVLHARPVQAFCSRGISVTHKAIWLCF